MIYVNIYYTIPEEGDQEPEPNLVEVTYPNEEDFMKEREKEHIEPRNGHLNIVKGMYGRSGFFPNILEINGVSRKDGHITLSLPMQSCIIKQHYSK